LRFTFTLHGSLSPAVEQVIPEVNAKGAEIARYVHTPCENSKLSHDLDVIVKSLA